MSVERQFGDVMLICDECEEDWISRDHFSQAIRDAKLEGWLITKDEDTDEWTHLCPSCVKLLPRVAP